MSMEGLEACRDYMAKHRERVECRAQERGQTVRLPRYDVCEQMKAKELLR
jgi:hypothetical protein